MRDVKLKDDLEGQVEMELCIESKIFFPTSYCLGMNWFTHTHVNMLSWLILPPAGNITHAHEVIWNGDSTIYSCSGGYWLKAADNNINNREPIFKYSPDQHLATSIKKTKLMGTNGSAGKKQKQSKHGAMGPKDGPIHWNRVKSLK